jgi:acyl-CoA oxidase
MARTHDFTTDLRPSSPGGPAIIEKDRAGSEIAVSELSKHLLGHEFLERQQRVLSILENHKVFSKTSQMNLSRPDRYRLGLARGKKLRQLVDKHSWSEEDYELAKYLVDDSSPYTLHTSMFLNCLMEQTSDEQRDYWLPRHNRWEIIGAYAQTEMGHGSNVKGIELEAKWDPETKEFILHSPTLTSSKWWPGSLGRTANHAIVVAQLLLPEPSRPGQAVQYKNYGPHPFIMQIRDGKTHQPLDGIVIGDIGPKYGYAPMDNGYMLFNHHRYYIPLFTPFRLFDNKL